MDAAHQRFNLQPLVLLAELSHFVASARRDRPGRGGHMAGICWCVAVWRQIARRYWSFRTLSYIAISQWPMSVPHHYKADASASAPQRPRRFLLVGTLFLWPVILVYSGWAYWVFRGKVRAQMWVTTEPWSRPRESVWRQARPCPLWVLGLPRRTHAPKATAI